MREQGGLLEETITITKLEYQDGAASGTNGTCPTTTAGSATVHMNPTIIAGDTVQNQPAANTVPSQTRAAKIVPSGQSTTVTTAVTAETGFPLPSDAVKIYYNVDANALAAAPTRPANAKGGGNYAGSATGVFDGAAQKWNIAMPSNPDRQIWFYLEAMDGTATDSFARNFDIYPDSGVFTYVQCGTSLPTVGSLSTQVSATIPEVTTVTVTVSTTVPLKSPVKPLSGVWLTVTDDPTRNGSLAPAFTGTKAMCFGSNGSCSGTESGSSQAWTTTYISSAPDGTKTVAHDISITATNACDASSVPVTKEFNK
jgi:hypothetical protein